MTDLFRFMAMQDKARPEPPSREASLARIVMNADIREERSYSMDEFVHASNMVEKNLKQLNDGLDRAMRTRQSTSELQHILDGLQEKHERSATMRRQMSQETMNHVYSLRHRAEQDEGNNLDGIGEMIPEEEELLERSASGAITKAKEKTKKTVTKKKTTSVEGEKKKEDKKNSKNDSTALNSVEKESAAATAAALEQNVILKLRVEQLEAELLAKEKENEELVVVMKKEKEKSDKRQVELKNELTLAQTLIKQTLQQVWDLQAKQASMNLSNADADGQARSRIEL